MTAITLTTNMRANQRIEVYKPRTKVYKAPTEDVIFFGLASDFACTALDKYHNYSVSDIFTSPSEDVIYIEIDRRIRP